MENETENTQNTGPTPPETETSQDPDAPRAKIELGPRRRKNDMPRDYEPPQCVAVASLGKFMKLPPDTPEDEINRLLTYLEYDVTAEEMGSFAEMNRLYIERAKIFDLACRYYFSGGQGDKINDESFKLSLKAGKHSLDALMSIRKHELQLKRFEMSRKYSDITLDERAMNNSAMMRRARQMTKHDKYWRGYLEAEDM